ncbi:MAG: desulfoferrodoxin family protein [Methylovulum sp.]|uniref:desulfoferrodoxin family protein n=1 Tax=Methylovulum sp. TaxID=1916980 RepID=UPI00262A653E|nr:desulfoferrodoxin family protein [Methylovulum sp.]MDD2723175.1 desulfoferrodoxin family protein [Methylovulum sp.]MDD5124645.1 desulfoferrodoxin family protein [Methylovulum sp.]
MKRRDFIQLSATGLATSLIAPTMAQAESSQTVATADIYYTKESSGRWSGKAATHLPNIEVGKADGKVVVKVVTAHEMKGYEHYIVKHVLLDKNHQFIAEKMFNPMEDKAPISTFTLDSYSGTLYALSLCNKHDLWLSSVEV